MKVFGILFILMGVVSVFVALNGIGGDMPEEMFVTASLLLIILGAYFLYKANEKGNTL